MTRTRRIYNRPDSGIFKHPYRSGLRFCRCSFCRDLDKEPIILRKRRWMQFRHDCLLEGR